MASNNKITVDEPLISTDVDGLIRTVAERQKIPMSELQQLCRIDKKNFDKWIRVLEDEGYISIEYTLRGTNILWKGKEEYGPQPGAGEGEFAGDAAQEPELSFREAQSEAPEAVESQAAEEQQEPEPEELLSQYLAKRREGVVSFRETATDADETANAGAKTSTKTEPTTKTEPPAKNETTDELDVFLVNEVSPEPELAEPEIQLPEPKAAGQADEPEAEMEEPGAAVKPEPRAEPARQVRQRTVSSVDTREIVNAYMEEINKEKAQITELKKAKERVYRDKFAAVEGKMEADMVTLTEAILEKQSKIAELKERVLELPDKVDELEKLQEQMVRLREEGRGALERTGQKVDAFLRSIEDSKGEISRKTDSLNLTISKEKDRVRELEKIEASVDARLAKLQAATDAAKSQIDVLNQAMASLIDDIGQAADMRTDVAVQSVALSESVAKHGAELDSLESELEGIARIEHWVKEYIDDYEKKIESIEQYVGRSDDELAELKEAAESLYMNKYLGELHDMTEAYQNELGDAVATECDIEQKIAGSRSRISELIRDSQEMIRKLRSESLPGRDFGSMSALVKERTGKIKATLDEKERERMKLVEDSASVRKTKVVASSQRSAAPGGAPSSRSARTSFLSRSVPSRSAPAKKKRK